MPRELEIDETDLTKNEAYLFGVAKETEQLSQTLGGLAQITAQAQKDERAAYTNPVAAANIKNNARGTLKTLLKTASALIKQYGTSLKPGLQDVMNRVYTNLVTAEGYLKLPGPRKELKQYIGNISKAL